MRFQSCRAADDLYIRVDGSKIWPADVESATINSGDTVQIFASLDLSGQSFVTLHELDGDFVDPTDGEDDDDLPGSFMIIEAEDLRRARSLSW
jgi:hypothetical protein